MADVYRANLQESASMLSSKFAEGASVPADEQLNLEESIVLSGESKKNMDQGWRTEASSGHAAQLLAQ